MPYITVAQSPRYRQISFEEILEGRVDTGAVFIPKASDTRTCFVREVKPELRRRVSIQQTIELLGRFVDEDERLYQVDRASLYERFFIPKKSGGWREINAPNAELSEALRRLKTILESACFASHHTSAFAYVNGRCAVDAVRRHQRNDSHWSFKSDFSNFFGSTTPEFVLRMLSIIFPFSEITASERGERVLREALSLAFLNDGLPMGTPISPMLTNLIMIPIDHRLFNRLRDFNGKTFIYTRYSDDIQISSRYAFKPEDIIGCIQDALTEFHAPYSIKPQKTRYGSRNGSNWNLGVMLNKDNEITVGHKKKQRLRAALTNYTLDRGNGKGWDIHDVQVLSGLISYYKSVERACIEGIIARHNEKYDVDVEAMIAEDLF